MLAVIMASCRQISPPALAASVYTAVRPAMNSPRKFQFSNQTLLGALCENGGFRANRSLAFSEADSTEITVLVGLVQSTIGTTPGVRSPMHKASLGSESAALER